ncbi:hypothetical protein Tco_1541705 [Tanacetum coccineum]
MTTANQGMSIEEIERIVAQRVANAIEAIAIYESINQTKQRGTNRHHLTPNLKPRSQDTSLVALGQSDIKLARQKSYTDMRRKPIEFQVDNRVMLKVGSVAYKLELPQELSRVHNTFHFVEEPVEIMDREVKRLRQSRVPIVKVRWNSRRGPEFTWEREDQFRKKYPHLFTKTAPSSSAAS